MEFFVTSNGIPLHVSESGKGEKAFVFLHGYLETLYIWEEFRELLPDSFHFLSIDLPGHGLSGTDPVSNTMSFDAEVLSSLLDKLQIRQVILVGHSMGGYVAQAFLKSYPDRVLALVHFNSNVHADDPQRRPQRLKEIEFIQNGKLITLAQLALPNMYAPENLRCCDDKIQETLEIAETHDPLGICASVRGLMDRPDNLEFLHSAEVPLLFLFGDQDRYTSEEQARRILESVGHCEGAIIPHSGHNSFIERSQPVLQEFLSFLERHQLL